VKAIKGETRHAARAASGDFSSLEFAGAEIATLGEPFNGTRGRPLTGRRIVRVLKRLGTRYCLFANPSCLNPDHRLSEFVATCSFS
jgi:hypothetical protein